MKVSIIDSLCQGHARCFAIEPRVFDLDDQGHSVILTTEVSPELRDTVQEAAANCPERAVALIDADA